MQKNTNFCSVAKMIAVDFAGLMALPINSNPPHDSRSPLMVGNPASQGFNTNYNIIIRIIITNNNATMSNSLVLGD